MSNDTLTVWRDQYGSHAQIGNRTALCSDIGLEDGESHAIHLSALVAMIRATPEVEADAEDDGSWMSEEERTATDAERRGM